MNFFKQLASYINKNKLIGMVLQFIIFYIILKFIKDFFKLFPLIENFAIGASVCDDGTCEHVTAIMPGDPRRRSRNTYSSGHIGCLENDIYVVDPGPGQNRNHHRGCHTPEMYCYPSGHRHQKTSRNGNGTGAPHGRGGGSGDSPYSDNNSQGRKYHGIIPNAGGDRYNVDSICRDLGSTGNTGNTGWPPR